MTVRREVGSGAIYALVFMVVLQVGVLLYSSSESVAGVTEVEPGFDFGALEVTDADGQVWPLASGKPLLVLVFHSECAHCRVVAPEWATWLETPPDELSVIAVSRESTEVASNYAAEHGWAVSVRSALNPALGSPAHALTRRTPWVFGLDGFGHVVSTGHGSDLQRVADELIADSGS